MKNECWGCDFNDPDYGCTCPPGEEWYACGQSNPTEEDFKQPTDTCVTCENFIGGGDWGGSAAKLNMICAMSVPRSVKTINRRR